MAFQVQGLDHVALAVADQRSSDRWYRDVLGLEREYSAEWATRRSRSWRTAAAWRSSRHLPATSGIQLRHIAFRVDRENFHRAQADLDGRGIAFEFQHHGVSQSIYFGDPDGLRLEPTTYEV